MKLTLKVRQIPGLTRLDSRDLALPKHKSKVAGVCCYFP